MKSLLFAPALVSFVNSDLAVDANEVVSSPVPELLAFTIVEEHPLVEILDPLPFVPVVAKEGEENRLHELQNELDKLAASLKATQQAVENVAKQRDEAREEVRALTAANHEMLGEMKAFRQQMEAAHNEAEKWKAHAAKMERKANDQVLANAELQKFRTELQGAIKEFQVMKGDLARARTEFQDPIERANLKEQLAESKAKQERLGDEIEMALIAREKTIQESARTRRELEGKMETLMKQAQAANELRDELRSTNAAKMKALADVEVLRKEVEKSEASRATVTAELETAQGGLVALQAEKTAALELGTVAARERDEARAEMENLRGALEQARAETETVRKAATELTEELKTAEIERETTRKQLAEASGVIEKTQEELVFLNKAKGGLEELLFKKTADIRKLKGELRKAQASREQVSPPREGPESPDDSPTEEGVGEERATAQALAD